MPAGGTLQLTASTKVIAAERPADQPRRYVEVTVEDTGSGMDPETTENIFSPFFTTKPQGTGLGLTISRGIVQEHEGWIQVESAIGKGSIFRVGLPCAPEEGGNDG